ncbi:MAG: hypothetical protein WB564_06175 [Dehalococcoidia bacterium]
MVIVIVQELEFDEVDSEEAVASIVGGLSLLAGSADPGEEPPPKNKKSARIEAKHRNLTTRLNVPSSHPGQDASSYKQPPLSLSAAAPSSQAVPNISPPPPLLPRPATL